MAGLYIKRSGGGLTLGEGDSLDPEEQYFRLLLNGGSDQSASLEVPENMSNGDVVQGFEPPQKRYLCRKYFIYNPVKGRCQPTVQVMYLTLKYFSITYGDQMVFQFEIIINISDGSF